MGKTGSVIDEEAKRFIGAQQIFFVASASLGPGGHVNLSPKGLDTFRILGPNTVAYLDFNGSGIETIAHLKENGRIVLMFCAFQGPPNIFRLYGLGRAVESHQTEFAALAENFPAYESFRSIIVIDITRVTDSCGYGVPRFKYEGEREQLAAWARKQGTEGLQAYRERKNRVSIDGLPGLSLRTQAVRKQPIHKQDRQKQAQQKTIGRRSCEEFLAFLCRSLVLICNPVCRNPACGADSSRCESPECARSKRNRQ